MKATTIFETFLSPSEQTPVVENIQATRNVDGSITLRTIRNVVGEYPISIPKTLSAEDVETFATALMGTHPGFVALASRADEWRGDEA